jgi:hypothetical protein
MAKLILSMDGLVLKEIPLLKERMSIGRKAHNDIQIDNMAISGEHAAVVTILNDSFLEDLNSTNGTLVNGQSVKKHFLKDGDVIELGKYKMKYLAAVGGAGRNGGLRQKHAVSARGGCPMWPRSAIRWLLPRDGRSLQCSAQPLLLPPSSCSAAPTLAANCCSPRP